MTHRLVQISFMFPGVPKVRDLEPVFSATGDDWVRIELTNWLLWTDKPAPQLLQHIIPHLDQQDNVLIAAIADGDFMGRQPVWVWDWIKSKMDVVTGSDPDNALANALQKYYK